MILLRLAASKIRALFSKTAVETRLDEELRFHQEMIEHDNLRGGMSPTDARRAAAMSLGGLDQIKENCRDARGLALIDSGLQDIRYAVRTAAHSPGFTAIAICTLIVGIGASTAVFSAVNAVLLSALPYRNPERLALIEETGLKRASPILSRRDYETFVENSGVFDSDPAYFRPAWFKLKGSGDPERFWGYQVSSNLLSVLGIQPYLGRLFEPEDISGAQATAVLSYGLWRRKFGGNPDIIGSAITLDNHTTTVIGVMPAGFAFPPPLPAGSGTVFQRSDLWEPLKLSDVPKDDHQLFAIGRLGSDIDLENATRRLDQLAHSQRPFHDQNAGSTAAPLSRASVQHVRLALIVLLCAVGCVLLIGCVNLANLLLAKSARRGREMAVRHAIGAGRARLIRQLLTESLLLSLVGGAGGMLFGSWAISIIWKFAPDDLRFFERPALSLKVVAFSLCISVGTALLFGTAPAIAASRRSTVEGLKESGGSARLGRGSRAWTGALVVLEIGLAVVLLSGSGLLVRSFIKLWETDLGFRPDHLLTLSLHLPSVRYPTESDSLNFFRSLLGQLSALPGAQAAGGIDELPVAGSIHGSLARSDHLAGEDELRLPVVEHYEVTPGYFAAMGIEIASGRAFADSDAGEAPRVTVINQAAAEYFWPGQQVVGQEVQLQEGISPSGEVQWGPWLQVVGVIVDARVQIERAPLPTIYQCYLQYPGRSLSIAIRSTGDPRVLASSVRALVWSLDGNLVVANLHTMEDLLSDSAAASRFRTWLLGVFAAIALLLAAIGLYGVVSYSVEARTHEIGIRMALGAERVQVIRLVLGHTAMLVAIGLVAGLAVALLSSRSLGLLLYRVAPNDPVTFVAVSASLALVGLVASLIPARRATRVDPTIALRAE